jgi:hypothetical protein
MIIRMRVDFSRTPILYIGSGKQGRVQLVHRGTGVEADTPTG